MLQFVYLEIIINFGLNHLIIYKLGQILKSIKSSYQVIWLIVY